MKILPTLVGLISVFYFAACSDNGSSAEAFNAAKVCPESGRGTFVDERDGQEYRYTTIGNQVWMAQNLNYDLTDETLPDPLTGELKYVSISCLYPDDNCMEKGRLYNWVAANHACPEGWHLPDADEWVILFQRMGGTDIAGYRLKSTEGWRALEAGKESGGSDECAFDLIPAKHSSQNAEGLFSDIWTGTLRTDGGYTAYVVRFQFNSNGVEKMTQFLDKYTLRCIKN